MDFIPSIDLRLPEKLRDPEYRREFFDAETSAQIAHQLIDLRKLRGMSQTVLAAKIGTKQAGISRIESADYGKWSFNTLRKIAEVLDARLRVIIQPSEAVLEEYQEPDEKPEILQIFDSRNLGEQRDGGVSATRAGNLRSRTNEAYISGSESRHSLAANDSKIGDTVHSRSASRDR